MKFNGSLARRRRFELGKSLGEVALAVGMSKSWLSQVERGLFNPKPGTSKQLAAALDTDLEALWTAEGDAA